MKRFVFAIALNLMVLPACRARSDEASSNAFASQAAGTTVSFEITPQVVERGRLTLALHANTHSGDLAEVDLKQAMRLHAGGESYAPVQAPSLSGHHDGGSVVFEPSGAPDHFVVTIAGVRQMGELRFSW